LQPNYKKLTKEEINELPLRYYEGPVHIVSSLEDAERACDALSREKIIGFDTETRPTFRKGEINPTSILQLAGYDRVYIIQLHKLGLSESIIFILSHPDIIKCGIALDRDLIELMQLSPFDPQAFIDLGEIARRSNVPHHGLRGLAALFFGFRISKQARTSNWSAKKLTTKQINYAATDAWVGRELYSKFIDEKLI